MYLCHFQKKLRSWELIILKRKWAELSFRTCSLFQVRLGLPNEEVCVWGWGLTGMGSWRRPASRILMWLGLILCSPVPYVYALGLLAWGLLAAESRSLPWWWVGIFEGQDGITPSAWKLFLGQVYSKGIQNKMAYGSHKVPTPLVGRVGRERVCKWGKGQEGEIKSMETFLAGQEVEISPFACAVGLPLTYILFKGLIFFSDWALF